MAEGAELIKKLQLKAGAKLRLVNVPREIAAALSAAPGIELVKPGAPCDAILAFAESPSEVTSLAEDALHALPADGLLWFAYRKGEAAKKSGLSRDIGWDALTAADWRPVRSVAIDEVWTGLRFKPVASVVSAKPDAWRTRGRQG